ncbi:protein TIFY 6B-like, partial [Trifolium medium]|nr:protein TIFY 6B-like [Trifolium medium]
AGLTEPCVKPSASVSQLTIFYAGTVNIFNDTASEKAQAIMLLAGNGISAASNMVQHEVQEPSSKFASGDDGISSPLSVSSHTGPQSGSGSNRSD